ncbi:MAG: alpha/beta hydrolase [Acidimicrobiales bacterium]
MTRDLRRKHAEINGIKLAYVDEGEGSPVVLLHGFPDSADLWRNQVSTLVNAGRRVIAPDLRGFGESDAPADVDSYQILNSAADVLGLCDHLKIGRMALVGHDWGSALGWALAAFAADRVERYVGISVGHPATFVGEDFEQREKSWYMLFFQFEGVAEEWLRADDWANLRAWVTSGVRRADDLDRWIADLSRPGRLEASLGWYRANVPPSSWVGDSAFVFPPVACPVMGVWSSADMALTEGQMTRSASNVSGDFRYERIDGVSHWIPVEAPDQLNALLLDFL